MAKHRFSEGETDRRIGGILKFGKIHNHHQVLGHHLKMNTTNMRNQCGFSKYDIAIVNSPNSSWHGKRVIIRSYNPKTNRVTAIRYFYNTDGQRSFAPKSLVHTGMDWEETMYGRKNGYNPKCYCWATAEPHTEVGGNDPDDMFPDVPDEDEAEVGDGNDGNEETYDEERTKVMEALINENTRLKGTVERLKRVVECVTKEFVDNVGERVHSFGTAKATPP
jgi:hypothetical protein